MRLPFCLDCLVISVDADMVSTGLFGHRVGSSAFPIRFCSRSSIRWSLSCAIDFGFGLDWCYSGWSIVSIGILEYLISHCGCSTSGSAPQCATRLGLTPDQC